MIEFVNAKINIGLQIVSKRADGYHDLQTIFYPIGKYAGTPLNPEPFCDILEISERGRKTNKRGDDVVWRPESALLPEFLFSGRKIECDPEKNLIVKAAKKIQEATGLDLGSLRIGLDKHIPDGAGIGGGSADAAFTLRMLYRYLRAGRELNGDENELLKNIALGLGADCSFFLFNQPAYASGVGERLEAIQLDLEGLWLVLVKPGVYVSTKEAFRGVTPCKPEFDLKNISNLPLPEWREYIMNDFEKSIFPQFPEIENVKEKLYEEGALYASMSGSGSSVYGIFALKDGAERAKRQFEKDTTIEATCLLKL